MLFAVSALADETPARREPAAPTTAPAALVTGRDITPSVVPVQNVGSLPVNMIPVRDGKYVVTTDAGFRQCSG